MSGEKQPDDGLLSRREDGYVIELAGWELNSCSANGYSVRLDFARYKEGEPERHAELMIETRFSVRLADSLHQLAPRPPEKLAPVLELLRRTVQSAQVSGDGTLQLIIGDAEIEVPPDPNFEAWQMTSSGFFVVCVPGGGDLAIWPDQVGEILDLSEEPERDPDGSGPDPSPIPESARRLRELYARGMAELKERRKLDPGAR